MKKFLMTALSLAFLGTSAGLVANAEMISLRGDLPLDANAEEFDRRRQETMDGGFKKSWKQQPPSIPHKINKDEITLQVNTCLRCHGEENFKDENAPKIGDSHYAVSEGKVTADLDMRRYTCNLCHAPQLDVDDLVENTFETIKQ